MDTLLSLSKSEDIRGSFQNFEFQQDGNSAKWGPGGLQKEDGSDLSQMTGFKGPNKNQNFQLLEGPKEGVKIGPFEFEEGEIINPKEMSGGGNFDLCINGKRGVELSILAHASIGVIRSSKDLIKEAVDGKNLIRNDGSKGKGLSVVSSVWFVFMFCSGLVSNLFCPREANCLADQLAKKGSRNGGEVSALFFWFRLLVFMFVFSGWGLLCFSAALVGVFNFALFPFVSGVPSLGFASFRGIFWWVLPLSEVFSGGLLGP
ncbi:hypothetical protein Q3G72_000300 [Acer saccharum]|nr:hypothetical protein Q3G72_000300 [Acer saccharum]